ncbi:MAG: long-chain fatty acid--CoA ligase [Rubricoccaceae bacterium]|nr:long-chain fatty acid--CoA ligase [Rubricoccaceae bacterium]
MALDIRTAPPNSGEIVLGRTLPSLLDEAVEKYPNPKAFNQPIEGGGWTTLSNAEFKTAADEMALGLYALGMTRGDHIAFFMNSDMYFAMADFACVIGGIVNVPLYTTYTPENLVYVANHGKCKAMVVSNDEMLAEAASWMGETEVRFVVLAEGTGANTSLPSGVALYTFDSLREKGRERLAANPDEPNQLREHVDANELATLIYTSGTTGLPKGVMLSHENISSNVFAALTGFKIIGHQEENMLTFLPMTHIFARTLSFLAVAYGHSIYYSDPDHIVEHLGEVKPTFFASVPRVLEKVYDKVLLGVREATGLKKAIGGWALDMAKTYDLSKPDGGMGWLSGLADKLVYSKLRERLGLTRVKVCAVGGAALRADLASSFFAFGIPVYQGYGLTETSPIITMNRPGHNRAGSVGQPIAGVEVAIAEDGEILSRGPHIMMGYYDAPDKTAEVMDDEGWFHTGDIGEFTDEGYLRITDRKKALFKLSTGKYVIPQPIENSLMEDPLVEQAVVIGSSYNYTTALLFPNMETLRNWAENKELDTSVTDEELLTNSAVMTKFEQLVEEANEGADHWCQVKRFKLIPELMTVENKLLTPTMKVVRRKVGETYGSEIEAMYAASIDSKKEVAAV